jgi:hydroxyacylglutathione hydrolase
MEVILMIQHSIPLGINRANCYILVDEKSREAVVIDPGEFNDDLVSIIKHGNISTVKYILLTHGHYDHILGVYDFKQYSGALIGIHENDAVCLSDESKSGADRHLKNGQSHIKPDFFLEDAMDLSFGETKLKVLFTPGHTLGGVCFICENDKKLFTGDTLFYHTIGRTDLAGGSMSVLQESLKRILNLTGDYIIFPGHDRSSTLNDERLYNKYLRSI